MYYKILPIFYAFNICISSLFAYKKVFYMDCDTLYQGRVRDSLTFCIFSAATGLK